MLVALIRDVSSKINECELTHLMREPIDIDRARRQHRQYEQCLIELGCTIHRLPAEDDLPDSVFVEDTAIVLEELAVITRPGAESRRAEIESTREALLPCRRLYEIGPPGTLDGGDVLRVGNTLFVGLTARSDMVAIQQLRSIVSEHGYEVRAVAVHGCLHLKTGVSAVGKGTLLINRDWVDAGQFPGMELIDVAPGEPMAANALLIGERVLFPQKHVETRKRLEQRGIAVTTVDISELAKAEAGVTCCSILFTC